MPSIFSRIIQGDLPAYTIAEDDDCSAFLDINPNARGHVLCVPKKEVDKLFDLDDDLYIKLMQFSKRMAAALEKALPCKRVGMAVVGLEVPHAHVHLIPLNEMHEMTFQTKVKMSDKDFENLVTQIKAQL